MNLLPSIAIGACENRQNSLSWRYRHHARTRAQASCPPPTPLQRGNRLRLPAKRAFGMIDVTVQARMLPDNPKTSMLASMSLVRAVEQRWPRNSEHSDKWKLCFMNAG